MTRAVFQRVWRCQSDLLATTETRQAVIRSDVSKYENEHMRLCYAEQANPTEAVDTRRHSGIPNGLVRWRCIYESRYIGSDPDGAECPTGGGSS